MRRSPLSSYGGSKSALRRLIIGLTICSVLATIGLSTSFATGVSADSISQFVAGFFSPGSTGPAVEAGVTNTKDPGLTARSGHTATLMRDGRVLIVGGDELGSAQIFDPTTGEYSAAGFLSAGSSGHTATLLADGRVFVAGGKDRSGNALSSTEIFSAGAFVAGPEMRKARSGHTVTVLADGQMMLIGGNGAGDIEMIDAGATRSRIAKGVLAANRSGHSAQLLKDGTIIVVGGRNAGGEAALAAERIDPRTMEIEAIGSLNAARVRPTLNELPDGKVQVIGGNDEGTMEVYSPATKRFSGYGHVIPNRDQSKAAAFRSANGAAVLAEKTSEEAKVLGSASRTALISHGEAPDSLLNRTDYASAKVGNKTIVFGGINANGTALNTTLETPESEATVTTDQVDYYPGETVHITGTGWEPGETVELTIERDRVPIGGDPEIIVLSAVADENGNIANSEYLVQQEDLGASFVLTAVGQTSGRTAQTTFTDSPRILSITPVNLVQSPDPVTQGSSATYSFTINRGSGGGSSGAFTACLQVFNLPAGATGTFSSGSTGFIASEPNCSNGPALDFTPTVNSRSGTLTIATTSLTPAGISTFTLRAGTLPSTFAAPPSDYADNADELNVLASTVAITLVQAAPTPASQAFGAGTPVTLSATLTRTSGGAAVDGASVSFTVTAPGGGSTVLVGTTNGSGVATVSYTPSAVGSYSSAASFAGATISSVVYTASSSPVQTFAVVKADQTINFGPLATKTYGDAPFTVSATGGASGNPVVFTASGNCLAGGTNGETITITGAGSCTVTANQAGNTNYNAAPPVQQTFTINKADSTTTVTCLGAPFTYNGSAQTPCSATVTGPGGLNLTGLTPTYNNNTNAGTASATYNYDGDANYNPSADSKNFTIGQASVTATAGSGSNVYDGATHSPSPCVVSGAYIGNLSCANNPASVGPGVGTTTISPVTSGPDLANFIVTSVDGSYTISPAPITITGGSGSNVYDGVTHSPSACTVSGAYTGSVTCTNNPASVGPGVGTTAIVPVPAGADLANFTVTPVNGSYTISPAEVTATAGSGSGSYNGSTQSPSACIVSGAYIGNLSCANSPASVGPGVGTTTINPVTSGPDLANFTVTNVDGSYTISPALVTATAGSGSSVYDGATHSPSACVVSGTYIGGLSCVNDPATVGPGVGTTTILPVTSGADIANFTITPANGSYTISQKDASVTPDALGKVYGDADPTLTGTLSGFVAGDGVTAVYSRTAGETVASSPYTISAVLSPAGVLGNYNITYNTAEFNITKRSATWTTNPNSKTYGNSDPVGLTTGFGSNFVASDNVTATYTRVAGENASPPTYHITATLSATPMSALDNYIITNDGNEFTINKRPATWTTNANSKLYGNPDPSPLTTGFGTNFMPADGVTASYSRAAGSNVGTYAITATLSSTPMSALANYTITNAGNTFTINPDPTIITPDSDVSGILYDCTDNTYSATLTDTVTGGGLGGISLKMTIGTQSATATTNASGVATFILTLNQDPNVPVTQKFELDPSFTWADGNRIPPPATTPRSFDIVPDPTIGPGINADKLYTGSNFFWTTSSTSSTATLTLSATIKDSYSCPSSPEIVGDITKAKVSFLISTNGGTSFSAVSNAQNLPVGLVDPLDPTTGAASHISQYNIGNNQSVTLIVRVVVSGYYALNTNIYDSQITIGKPGTVNSLMGGGALSRLGGPYLPSGYLGTASASSEFGSQVTYNNSGTNPKGQVTVTIRSCNRIDGTVDPNCSISDPATHHIYWIKSNSISELSRISGAATFGSKVNGYELLPNGTKVNFDSGNTMQLVFTPFGVKMPAGTYATGYGTASSPTNTCSNANGCASIVIFRSAGGVWYSSSWGAPHNSTTPRTVQRNVVNGAVSVN